MLLYLRIRLCFDETDAFLTSHPAERKRCLKSLRPLSDGIASVYFSTVV